MNLPPDNTGREATLRGSTESYGFNDRPIMRRKRHRDSQHLRCNRSYPPEINRLATHISSSVPSPQLRSSVPSVLSNVQASRISSPS